MLTVPLDVTSKAKAEPLPKVPPVSAPTMLMEFGDAAVYSRQAPDAEAPLIAAVTVIPFAVDVNFPVPALFKEMQFTFPEMVMVCPVAAVAVSADVGTTPPTQVDVALKSPD